MPHPRRVQFLNESDALRIMKDFAQGEKIRTFGSHEAALIVYQYTDWLSHSLENQLEEGAFSVEQTAHKVLRLASHLAQSEDFAKHHLVQIQSMRLAAKRVEVILEDLQYQVYESQLEPLLNLSREVSSIHRYFRQVLKQEIELVRRQLMGHQVFVYDENGDNLIEQKIDLGARKWQRIYDRSHQQNW